MVKAWQTLEDEAASLFRALGFSAIVRQRVEGVRSAHEVDVLVTFEKLGIAHCGQPPLAHPDGTGRSSLGSRTRS